MKTSSKHLVRGLFHAVVMAALILNFSAISIFLIPHQTFAQEEGSVEITTDNSAAITINKIVDNQPAQGWEFTIELGEEIEPLKDSTDEDGNANFTVEIIEGGTTVDITESLQTGYDMLTASCILDIEDSTEAESKINEYKTDVGIFNGIDSVEGVEVMPGDNIYCTFENHLLTFCGDNIKQTPNDNGIEEECDSEDGVPDEHHECTLNCNLEYIPYCGDGIINQEWEKCDITEGITDNQTCSEECTIVEKETTPTPILTIAKSVDKDLVYPGDILIYTIAISNPGTEDAQEVTLTDTLPAGFFFLNNESKNTDELTKTWLWDALAAGDSLFISYGVVVDEKIENGRYENTTTVSAKNHQPSVTASISIEVEELTFLKRAGMSPKKNLLTDSSLLSTLRNEDKIVYQESTIFSEEDAAEQEAVKVKPDKKDDSGDETAGEIALSSDDYSEQDNAFLDSQGAPDTQTAGMGLMGILGLASLALIGVYFYIRKIH